MSRELTRRPETKDIAIAENFSIGSLEDMKTFMEAYIAGMEKHFTQKSDLKVASESMRSRLVGLMLDMKFADLFKHEYSVEAKVNLDGSMVMVIINKKNNKRREFLNFEFHNREGSEIQPTEGHRWFYTQAFAEAGGFLRGVAFNIDEK